MSDEPSTHRFSFPPWANYALPALVIAVVGGAVYVPLVVLAGGSPRTTDRGYMPEQPVAYSHALHVGELGMDCRYCHTTVEEAAFAALPPTQTCMNCHLAIAPDTPAMLPVRESYTSGEPIEWVKIHDLPDFVYFNHSAHVTRGIGCVSCHGRVDRMEQVYQVETLSMAWCLACHRDPSQHLRPPETVTEMDWVPQEGQRELGRRLMEELNIRGPDYMMSCSLCHR